MLYVAVLSAVDVAYEESLAWVVLEPASSAAASSAAAEHSTAVVAVAVVHGTGHPDSTVVVGLELLGPGLVAVLEVHREVVDLDLVPGLEVDPAVDQEVEVHLELTAEPQPDPDLSVDVDVEDHLAGDHF